MVPEIINRLLDYVITFVGVMPNTIADENPYMFFGHIGHSFLREIDMGCENHECKSGRIGYDAMLPLTHHRALRKKFVYPDGYTVVTLACHGVACETKAIPHYMTHKMSAVIIIIAFVFTRTDFSDVFSQIAVE